MSTPSPFLPQRAAEKQQQLFAALAELDSLLVAFSGGADSAYLAWAAHLVLGARALAVTALSASFSAYDREQAEAFVREVGLRHRWIVTNELANPSYVANNADRCYHCKDELFGALDRLAAEQGYAAVAYGINADDTQDFRPGHRAAREHRVLAPLLDAGLTKTEIRELSRAAGLRTWNRPASACLASRVPYGTPVTAEVLSRVEQAEAALRALGFHQFRVRYHDAIARIELAPEELPRALDPVTARLICERVKQAGFTFVTLDLEGYRQGSLNLLLRT
ncbi:MAG: ATP-dependent sacrificial sulfur transferase LarE [Firmicutes bacterium]|nr:ATP-dependent sacrificial sulfur transferase LarE [Bacillota bacterium]